MTVNGQLFENFREIFLHRSCRALEPRKRVRPDRAAPFSVPADWGTRTASAGSPLTGGRFFQHRLSGTLELPQAGSPFPGGEFSAEPQRGIRRLRTAGTLRRPPRGQKGRDTCGFPSSLNSYLSLVGIAWVQTVDCVSRKRTRQSGYSCVSFSAFSQFTDSVLLHRRFTLRRRGIPVSRNSLVWRLRTAPTD